MQEFRLKREVGALATPRVKLIPRFPPHWAWNYARRSSQKFAGKIPNSTTVCLSSSSLSHFAIYASRRASVSTTSSHGDEVGDDSAFPYVTDQIGVTEWKPYLTQRKCGYDLRSSNCLRGLKWPKLKPCMEIPQHWAKNQCITTPPATRWFNFD